MGVEAAKNNLPWHSRQAIHLFSTSSHISCFWSCCTYFAADCWAPAITLEGTRASFSATFYYLSFWEWLHKPNIFLRFSWFSLLAFDLGKREIFFSVVERQCGDSFLFLLPIFSCCWGIHLGLVLRQSLLGFILFFFHLSDIANTTKVLSQSVKIMISLKLVSL